MTIPLAKKEREWLSIGKLPEYTKRAIVITLRKDNIEMLESMTCDEIISYVEKLDDNYYCTIPTINQLAEIYGDKNSTLNYEKASVLLLCFELRISGIMRNQLKFRLFIVSKGG